MSEAKQFPCTNPEYHGNPFRYCVCGWSEDAHIKDKKPIVSEASTNDIENRFSYNPPKDKETVAAHELIRAQVKTMAHYWDGNLPTGREKALAITKLEEAMFWANAAIARNHD